MNSFLTRCFDVTIALVMIILSLPLVLVALGISWVETGSPIFVQKRVGQQGRYFYIFKIRTMSRDVPEVRTNLVKPSAIPRLCSVLRKYKIDEFPQLINVINGSMSLVGPRPGLPSDVTLSKLRQQWDVNKVLPGITGLAQVRGVDMSNPNTLVEVDNQMIKQFSLKLYFRILLATVAPVKI